MALPGGWKCCLAPRADGEQPHTARQDLSISLDAIAAPHTQQLVSHTFLQEEKQQQQQQQRALVHERWLAPARAPPHRSSSGSSPHLRQSPCIFAAEQGSVPWSAAAAAVPVTLHMPQSLSVPVQQQLIAVGQVAIADHHHLRRSCSSSCLATVCSIYAGGGGGSSSRGGCADGSGNSTAVSLSVAASAAGHGAQRGGGQDSRSSSSASMCSAAAGIKHKGRSSASRMSGTAEASGVTSLAQLPQRLPLQELSLPCRVAAPAQMLAVPELRSQQAHSNALPGCPPSPAAPMQLASQSPFAQPVAQQAAASSMPTRADSPLGHHSLPAGPAPAGLAVRHPHCQPNLQQHMRRQQQNQQLLCEGDAPERHGGAVLRRLTSLSGPAAWLQGFTPRSSSHTGGGSGTAAAAVAAVPPPPPAAPSWQQQRAEAVFQVLDHTSDGSSGGGGDASGGDHPRSSSGNSKPLRSCVSSPAAIALGGSSSSNSSSSAAAPQKPAATSTLVRGVLAAALGWVGGGSGRARGRGRGSSRARGSSGSRGSSHRHRGSSMLRKVTPAKHAGCSGGMQQADDAFHGSGECIQPRRNTIHDSSSGVIGVVAATDDCGGDEPPETRDSAAAATAGGPAASAGPAAGGGVGMMSARVPRWSHAPHSAALPPLPPAHAATTAAATATAAAAAISLRTAAATAAAVAVTPATGVTAALLPGYLARRPMCDQASWSSNRAATHSSSTAAQGCDSTIHPHSSSTAASSSGSRPAPPGCLPSNGSTGSSSGGRWACVAPGCAAAPHVESSSNSSSRGCPWRDGGSQPGSAAQSCSMSSGGPELQQQQQQHAGLLALAVTRMHSAPAISHDGGDGTSSAAAEPMGLTAPMLRGHSSTGSLVRRGGGTSHHTDAAAASDDTSARARARARANTAEAVAAAFAEAFCSALATRDARWGSSPGVTSILAEDARMIGTDGQLYIGHTAIVRRLNGGMEQLLRVAGVEPRANSSNSSSSSNATQSAAVAAVGDNNQVQMPTAAAAAATPDVSISCPDPRGRPGLAVVVYNFRWGARRFVLRDELIVRGGRILRLRRGRG